MNSSTKQSLEQFLEELAKVRKNFGYPVIVAFDRKTANHVLKQEFIERYSGGLFLDPMNSEIDLEAGASYHQLIDFCLDEPRLSFENADLSNSKAKLMMRSVRGKHIQLSQPLGSTRRRVTLLAEATPVSGPSLVFDIDLKSDKGEVSKEGRAYFSFITENNYYFYGGTTQFEIEKLGQHFRNFFNDYDGAPEERTRIEYTLGQFGNLANSPLKPNGFAIRTHGAPETGRANTESFGDGAVVLFVELEGFNSDDAAPPYENQQLPYLLPSGYSANVLVNSDFLALNIVAPRIESIPHSVFLEFKPAAGTDKIKYRAEGKVVFSSVPVPQPSAKIYTDDAVWVPPAADDKNNGLTLEFIDNRLIANFTGQIDINVRVNSSFDPGVEHSGLVTLDWRATRTYKVELVEIDGARRMTLVPDDGYEFNLKYTWSKELGGIFFVYSLQERKFEESHRSSFHAVFMEIFLAMADLKLDVDTFIMSSLLFRNSQITIDALHQPNDFITIGQLATDRQKFIITPSDNGEISVLAGERIAFNTAPATQGVTWSVRHLPNYTGDDHKGEINENTGVYTSPDADKFKDSHTKVIVTAQKGTEFSHALVSVLRTSLNIFPFIVSVNLNSHADIFAGEMNGKDISMKVEGLGELVDSASPDPLAQATKRYRAPKEVPEWEEGMPAVDSVLRLDKVVVSSGTETKTVHILLPVVTEGPYWLKPKQRQTGVEFEFWMKPKSGPEKQVPKEQTSWHVRVGNGTIDDGVYTPHPSRPDGEYIVIVAFHEIPDLDIDLYGSIILPIPFVSAEKFLKLYASVEASDKLRRARINRK